MHLSRRSILASLAALLAPKPKLQGCITQGYLDPMPVIHSSQIVDATINPSMTITTGIFYLCPEHPTALAFERAIRKHP